MSNRKYHIKKDGTPDICRAKEGNCPLSPIGEHFTTKEEAMKFAEKSNEMWSKIYSEYNNAFIISRNSLAEEFEISEEELDRAGFKYGEEYFLMDNKITRKLTNDFIENNTNGITDRLSNDFGNDFAENEYIMNYIESAFRVFTSKKSYRGEIIGKYDLSKKKVQKICEEAKEVYIDDFSAYKSNGNYTEKELLSVFGVNNVNELHHQKSKQTVQGFDTSVQIDFDKEKYADKKARLIIYNKMTKKKEFLPIHLESFNGNYD